MRNHIYSWTRLGGNLLQDKKKKIIIYIYMWFPTLVAGFWTFFLRIILDLELKKNIPFLALQCCVRSYGQIHKRTQMTHCQFLYCSFQNYYTERIFRKCRWLKHQMQANKKNFGYIFCIKARPHYLQHVDGHCRSTCHTISLDVVSISFVQYFLVDRHVKLINILSVFNKECRSTDFSVDV